MKGGRNLYQGKEKVPNKGENENNILTFQPHFYRIICVSQTLAHLLLQIPLEHPIPKGPNPLIWATRETVTHIPMAHMHHRRMDQYNPACDQFPTLAPGNLQDKAWSLQGESLRSTEYSCGGAWCTATAVNSRTLTFHVWLLPVPKSAGKLLKFNSVEQKNFVRHPSILLSTPGN